MSYPQQPYYAPGWQPARPPVDGPAIAALVTGLLGLGPVAIVLGIVGLVRIRGRGTRGRGLAIAGIVLGAAGLIVLGVVIVLTMAAVTATRPLDVAVTERQAAHAQQLVPGHCLSALPTDGQVSTVEILPCNQQHTAEVVHSVDLETGWSGQEAVDRVAAALCQEALVDDGVLLDTQREAGVEWVVWAPTAASWRGGDRTVLCVAHSPGTPLVGSLLDGIVPVPSS